MGDEPTTPTDSPTPGPVQSAVADAFREEWGQVVATIIRLTGDWDLAEECAQDAFAAALVTWPRDGVPNRPGAWLTTVARNRAVDRLRRDALLEKKLIEVAGAMEPDPTTTDSGADGQDLLSLIFTCCHPALAVEAQVALTLRTLLGLTTAEIARAFAVTDQQTMTRRLVRAKQKIRYAGIPYRVPPAHLLPERTSAVLAVLYLLYREGYAPSSGERLTRTDLSTGAIGLARQLAVLMPDEPEADGLLALMLLHDARRPARTDAQGDLVLLADQDRSRWDREQIAEATALLQRALRRGRIGSYQIQAAIAACHATTAEPGQTDWAQIVGLYDHLAQIAPSAVVELNRAVAVSMAAGPSAALPAVESLIDRNALTGNHLLPATHADLLRRLGRWEEASAAYRNALILAPTEVERRFLRRRITEVAGPTTGQEYR